MNFEYIMKKNKVFLSKTWNLNYVMFFCFEGLTGNIVFLYLGATWEKL